MEQTAQILAGWNRLETLNIVNTFHAVALILLIFSERLTPPPHFEIAERIGCNEIVGWKGSQ